MKDSKILVSALLLIAPLYGQELKPSEATTSTARLWAPPTIQDFGGVTVDGQPYLVRGGVRHNCSLKTLIKAVERSNLTQTQKCQALHHLGKPACLVIKVEIQREGR